MSMYRRATSCSSLVVAESPPPGDSRRTWWQKVGSFVLAQMVASRLGLQVEVWMREMMVRRMMM